MMIGTVSSMNVGFDAKRLPVGLQLMAPWWEETRLLGTAAQYQAIHPSTLTPSPVALKFGRVAQGGC